MVQIFHNAKRLISHSHYMLMPLRLIWMAIRNQRIQFPHLCPFITPHGSAVTTSNPFQPSKVSRHCRSYNSMPAGYVSIWIFFPGIFPPVHQLFVRGNKVGLHISSIMSVHCCAAAGVASIVLAFCDSRREITSTMKSHWHSRIVGPLENAVGAVELKRWVSGSAFPKKEFHISI